MRLLLSEEELIVRGTCKTCSTLEKVTSRVRYVCSRRQNIIFFIINFCEEKRDKTFGYGIKGGIYYRYILKTQY